MMERQPVSWGNSGLTAKRHIFPFELKRLAEFNLGSSELKVLFSLTDMSVQEDVHCSCFDPNHLRTWLKLSASASTAMYTHLVGIHAVGFDFVHINSELNDSTLSMNSAASFLAVALYFGETP